jgi:CheY-like chemotaxis protein
VLDDDDARHAVFSRILPDCEVTHVYTAREACKSLVESAPFDLVCLDHDLGMFDRRPDVGFVPYFDDGTGTDVAEFIAHYLSPEKYPRKILIHSWNPAGARRMAQALWPTKIPVTVKEFSASEENSSNLA